MKAIPLRDTRVEAAGVMRCCLETVAEEYDLDAQVAIGSTSRCRYCDETFTLVDIPPQPTWKPDWQLPSE